MDENIATQIDEKAKEIDDIIYKDRSSNINKIRNNEIKVEHEPIDEIQREIIILNDKLDRKRDNSSDSIKIMSTRSNNKNINLKNNINLISYDNKNDFLESTSHTNKMPTISLPEVIKTEDEAYLSDIDDIESEYFLLSNEEYKLKKLLWEVLNKDWIEDQRNKIKKDTKKRKRKVVTKQDSFVAKTPLEAIKNSKFSKKMNLIVLTKLFEEKLVK